MNESRCVGHCCKRFAIEHSFDALQADLKVWEDDPTKAKIPDVEKIAPMVIPIASSKNGEEHVYTCKNLKSSGDCGIYSERPQMCRDFPDESGCHFWKCKSDRSAYHQKGFFSRLFLRYKWLRSLR